MNWIKENTFAAGLIGSTVLACGILGFLVFQASGSYTQASADYVQAVEKLHALQNRVPFPNSENLEKIKEKQEEYKQQIESFRQQIQKMQFPLKSGISPQEFQDLLRKTVNEIRSKAASNNVELPKDFYLGFDQYQSVVPSEKASTALERELRIITLVVTRLVDVRVLSINEIKRTPLPEEGAAPVPANSVEGAPKISTRDLLTLGFTADQGKTRIAINSLFSPEQFFIIRNLTVQNSNISGPLREITPTSGQLQPTRGAMPSGMGTPSPGMAAIPKPNEISVILGREMLKVNLNIEIVKFPEPPATTN